GGLRADVRGPPPTALDQHSAGLDHGTDRLTPVSLVRPVLSAGLRPPSPDPSTVTDGHDRRTPRRDRHPRLRSTPQPARPARGPPGTGGGPRARPAPAGPLRARPAAGRQPDRTAPPARRGVRSEERRVGKEGRSCGSPAQTRE